MSAMAIEQSSLSVLLLEPSDHVARLLEVMLGEGDGARFEVTRLTEPPSDPEPGRRVDLLLLSITRQAFGL